MEMKLVDNAHVIVWSPHFWSLFVCVCVETKQKYSSCCSCQGTFFVLFQNLFNLPHNPEIETGLNETQFLLIDSWIELIRNFGEKKILCSKVWGFIAWRHALLVVCVCFFSPVFQYGWCQKKFTVHPERKTCGSLKCNSIRDMRSSSLEHLSTICLHTVPRTHTTYIQTWRQTRVNKSNFTNC